MIIIWHFMYVLSFQMTYHFVKGWQIHTTITCQIQVSNRAFCVVINFRSHLFFSQIIWTCKNWGIIWKIYKVVSDLIILPFQEEVVNIWIFVFLPKQLSYQNWEASVVSLMFFETLLKVAFFQKVRFVFQISKSWKKIFQKTILNLKFKIPAHISQDYAMDRNFKFQVQDSFYIFLEIWKTNHTFWKSHL